jgi:CBS domain-containing protein
MVTQFAHKFTPEGPQFVSMPLPYSVTCSERRARNYVQFISLRPILRCLRSHRKLGEYMNKTLKARDVMEQHVISLRPETSLIEASKLFSEHKISGAPVVDANANLVGVLSQTDLLRRAYVTELSDFPEHTYHFALPYWSGEGATTLFDRLKNLSVKDAMNPYPITAKPDDSLIELAVCMRTHEFHRLIVIENRKVIGVVSALGLLGAFAGDQ